MWTAVTECIDWILYINVTLILWPLFVRAVTDGKAVSKLRHFVILFLCALLGLIGPVLRQRNNWGFELTHVALGAVAYGFIRTSETCLGLVNLDARATNARFVIYWMAMGGVHFYDIPKSPSTLPENAKHVDSVIFGDDFHSSTTNGLVSRAKKVQVSNNGDSAQSKQSYNGTDNSIMNSAVPPQFLNVRKRALRRLGRAFKYNFSVTVLSFLILCMVRMDRSLLSSIWFTSICQSIVITLGLAYILLFYPPFFELLYGDGICIDDAYINIFLAENLIDFWRRWNPRIHNGFVHCVYLPCGGRKNHWVATIAVGLASSTLHIYEVLLWRGYFSIAMPAFFLLQAIGVAIDRSIQTYFKVQVGSILPRIFTLAYLLTTSRYFFVDFGCDLVCITGKSVNMWLILLNITDEPIASILSI